MSLKYNIDIENLQILNNDFLEEKMRWQICLFLKRKYILIVSIENNSISSSDKYNNLRAEYNSIFKTLGKA